MKNEIKPHRRLPSRCPSCDSLLKITELTCDNCNTVASGSFSLPTFLSLDFDEQKFIIDFVKRSGSLKDMAREMNLSYPTVRNKLDSIIEKIENEERKQI